MIGSLLICCPSINRDMSVLIETEEISKKKSKLPIIFSICFAISAILFFISVVALRMLLPLYKECSSNTCRIIFLVSIIMGVICVIIFIILLVIVTYRGDYNNNYIKDINNYSEQRRTLYTHIMQDDDIIPQFNIGKDKSTISKN